MKPIPLTVFIRAPFPLYADSPRPAEMARVTLEDLCTVARIAMRVTGGPREAIVLHAGKDHYREPGYYYVGVGKPWRATRVQALRALEVLAYGFHDYAARECVCHRGLFVATASGGRFPSEGKRPMKTMGRDATDEEFQRAFAAVLQKNGPVFDALARFDEGIPLPKRE